MLGPENDKQGRHDKINKAKNSTKIKYNNLSEQTIIYYTNISCLGGVFAKNTSREAKTYLTRKHYPFFCTRFNRVYK
jgi:hypothetical protein